MIDFQSLKLEDKPRFDAILQNSGVRGCEYSFVNLFLWGRQKAAFYKDHLVFFSQFNRKSVYLFPVGSGDIVPVIEAVIHDAQVRGIPCRFTGLTHDDCAKLESLFPGRFRYHVDRDSFDYVYAIEDLVELKGRRFQKKRNHLNRFRADHPEYRLVPMTDENTPMVTEMVYRWYDLRLQENPHGDYHLEQAALVKALRHRKELDMEGLLLMDGDNLLAMAMGSRLNPDTFDIHFEKALEANDGTYAAINQGFALYLHKKYPDLRWLDREDDMGLEGLRKAKMSYNPERMIEKNWVCLLEDCYEY